MADPKKTADKTKSEKTEPEKDRKKDGTRETIESIVIAFIFAFLFRTFEAEAFVIPTGSMAPTLLGRHKDAACPKCGFEFAIGASDELDREGNWLTNRLTGAVCPNCRYRVDIRNDPAFIGDRILVTKFAYDIAEPDRWDVTVFKFPEDPTTNYIKRLCGLPNETIEIRQGDLYRIRDGVVEILRKLSGSKQQAVLQPVYDDTRPCQELLDAGWPERWAAVSLDDGPEAVAGWSQQVDGWQSDTEARSYRVEAGKDSQWLRYRHFVPTEDDWDDLGTGRLNPKARLILDFCSYNAVFPTARFDDGVYWVGDLAVSATVNLEKSEPEGQLLFELVEGSRTYRCSLDPTAGTATLSYVDALDRARRDAAARVLSEAKVDLDSPGDYEVKFANIDDRLWLWIDGTTVEFDQPNYEPFGGQLVQLPTPDDLTPVGIAAENLTVSVSNLKLDRDIYYRSELIDPHTANRPETQRIHYREVESEEELFAAADDPEVYGEIYSGSVPWLKPGIGEFYRLELGEDEFLLLGDNSPRSLDGRLWGNLPGELHRVHRHAVPRSALVGKALMIFWPHGLRLGNEQDGVPHGWTIPGLDRFFYHQRGIYEWRGGKQVLVGTEMTDYPKHGLPFYPDFGRIFQRIQ